MLRHRREDSLNIVDHNMITPGQQRPRLRSGEQTLTGPGRQTTRPLTTGMHNIQDVIDQRG
jgi:hypothetical protein